MILATSAGRSTGSACDAPGTIAKLARRQCFVERARVVDAHHVVVAGHDQRRCRDRCQVAGGQRGLGGDHGEEPLEHVAEVLRPVGGPLRIGLQHHFAERCALVEVDGHQPVMVVVGPDGDDAVDELRSPHRDEQGGDCAVTPPDQVRRAADDLLEHADGLAGHVEVVERTARVGGVSVRPAVEGDDAVSFEQRLGQHPAELVAVGHPTVQQQHRLVAAPAVVDPGRVPVALDALTHACVSIPRIP